MSQVFDLVQTLSLDTPVYAKATSGTRDERENKFNKKIIINIEIKDPQATRPVSQLIKNYIKDKGWSVNNFIVSSFDHDAISRFHNYLPDVKTGALFESNSTGIVEKTKQANASYVIIDYKSATNELIDLVHKSGLKIFAYTVNSKPEAEKLITLNIDGIATNYPDILG